MTVQLHALDSELKSPLEDKSLYSKFRAAARPPAIFKANDFADPPTREISPAIGGRDEEGRRAALPESAEATLARYAKPGRFSPAGTIRRCEGTIKQS